MTRFLRAIEGLTKALNRVMDFIDSVQQKEADEIAAELKALNDRVESAVDSQK